jgi:hypothetical protein
MTPPDTHSYLADGEDSQRETQHRQQDPRCSARVGKFRPPPRIGIDGDQQPGGG